MALPIRVTVRGFLGRNVIFERPLSLSEHELEALMPDMAEEHATDMVAGKLTMIEIEFPDAPEAVRYFRLGLDPSGMVIPLQITLL